VKRIGLLGGMSWESSIEYERLINEAVRDRLGGVASADLIVRSYNFAEIEALQLAGDWDGAGSILADGARLLERAGADVIALCTNTMHKVAPAVEQSIEVPFVHIVDATAAAIRVQELDRVALLGTRYTMEDPFYADRLAAFGVAAIVPDEPDRTMVHDVIFDELVRGVITTESRNRYLAAIDALRADGAQGVIAGCTEIELLVGQDDLDIPYFPSTALHVDAIVEAAFAD
jgi:aspartate racemase